ncbi:sulfatase-like hydrolase/transferase [Benzoatithermus flavus]|uniref:Sulfatase-like hydrolase/transferase n=1 Tax=Benzoatithermus flavus TaxID=3108223 RepID=A0ABU8XWP7_9PROT
MKRRDLMRSTAAFSAGMLAGFDPAGHTVEAATGHGHLGGRRPNILLILVDELRFPSVFPAGVHDVDGFLARFMPNTHALWRRGVKFGRHFTAATACTPARGVLISGLYSQQSWLPQTIKNTPDTRVSAAPVLSRAYPTYGKLLRAAGYRTPYVGKWHVAIPPASGDRLEAYGFQGLTYPDPTGSNLQGTVGDEANGYHNDRDIADQAVAWLSARRPGETPWCLTVSFVNPHDRQFFWAGTEFKTFNGLFDGRSDNLEPFVFFSENEGQIYPPVVPWDENPLKSPPAFGYPRLPPNWESAERIMRRKPSTQTCMRLFQALVCGGAADDPGRSGFEVVSYPSPPDTYGLAQAPFAYWRRGLDSYTQIMSIVDQRIGEVVAALPRAVARETIVVFTSDHGEYAGAHGFLAGKVGALYDEAFHVPLIVVDPQGRLTGDIDIMRQGLTSSVDMLPLLVSLGHGGSRDWLTGHLAELYGRRHDMVPMLRSARAPGRHYVLLVSDELIADYFNFNDGPRHLLGLRTETFKLGVYADWHRGTTRIDRSTIETEFYDYATEGGRAELDNVPGDPRASRAMRLLLEDLVPSELRAPLPPDLRAPQALARARYLALAAQLAGLDPSDRSTLHRILGHGFDF